MTKDYDANKAGKGPMIRELRKAVKDNFSVVKLPYSQEASILTLFRSLPKKKP